MRFSGLIPLLAVLTLSGFAQSSEVNVLTPAERAKGWTLLWQGGPLSDWTPQLVSSWKTKGGALTADQSTFFWLRQDTVYEDFILQADFRMLSPEADSGIFIRAAKDGNPTSTGYQININNINEEYATGSVVNRARYNAGPVAVNKWHHYEIKAEGDHISAVLDGKTTVDFHDSSSARGHIGLQFLKGEDVEFRNLKILRLGPPVNSRH